MNRRAIVIPVLLLAAAATGCSTFSDNDAAARVDEFQLSQDELDSLLVAATPTTTLPGSEPVDESDASAETARGLLNTWILTQIVEIDIAAQGQTVSDQAIADATGALAAPDPAAWSATPLDLQNLQVRQQAAIATWTALEVPDPSDAELLALYDAGTAESGVVCAAHILVETEDEAQGVLDQLAGGADFAELAVSDSIDTASGANGGGLPCAPTATFESTYVPEFVEPALAADLGEPFGPVESEFGYHIIVLQPSDQVDPAELATLYSETSARFQRAARAVDVYVDPRFGSFNAVTGVEPLG